MLYAFRLKGNLSMTDEEIIEACRQLMSWRRYKIFVWDMELGRPEKTVLIKRKDQALEAFVELACNEGLSRAIRIELTHVTKYPSAVYNLHTMFKPTPEHKQSPCEVCKEPSSVTVDGRSLCTEHARNYLRGLL